MDEPAIDETVYRELQAASGAEFVIELVATFLEDAPKPLAELRTARANGDAEKFRRAAHSLKCNGERRVRPRPRPSPVQERGGALRSLPSILEVFYAVYSGRRQVH